MLIAAAVLFLLAAFFGMWLASYVLTDRETPKGLAIIHGPLAVAGFICLVIGTIAQPSTPLIISIIIFSIAAIGGVTLIGIDLFGKRIPKLFALAHGLAAVTGYVFLL